MLYAGKDITSSVDQLKKIEVDYLVKTIQSPKPEILARIRQLRIIRGLDNKRYTQLKRSLPYFVCGAFNPSFRRTENFAYTEYFIVDIDHIEAKGLVLKDLRETIQKDSRVMVSFLSPSEDGIKLLFKLSERCYDAGLYSLFYKAFVRQLSLQYNLEQVIDARTSDVCRACFVSIDPDIYYNPEAETVALANFVNIDNPDKMFEQKHQLEKPDTEKEGKNNVEDMEKRNTEPDAEDIIRIKELLKLKIRPQEKEAVIVPEQLNEIIEDVRKTIEETGIIITEIININYGKKIRMRLGARQAEVNLFYGKRGFSVVQSPRVGTNAELNSLCADVIKSYFMQ